MTRRSHPAAQGDDDEKTLVSKNAYARLHGESEFVNPHFGL